LDLGLLQLYVVGWGKYATRIIFGMLELRGLRG
jgi:hypothetical protein